MSTLRPTEEVLFKFQGIIPPNPSPSVEVQFPSFIKSINDSFSPSWSENMDIGRADPKMMYQSYNRTISVNFITAALYNDEHTYYLKTLNQLAKFTMPTYKPGLGFNGIFVVMEIGDYIKDYGIITSLSFDVTEDVPWVDKVPMYINGQITFKSIGQKRPSYENTFPYYHKEPAVNKGKSKPGE